jgi:hypothetical protein
VLKLASAALRKVPARRLLVMRTRSKTTVIEQCIARNSESDVTPP